MLLYGFNHRFRYCYTFIALVVTVSMQENKNILTANQGVVARAIWGLEYNWILCVDHHLWKGRCAKPKEQQKEYKAIN